MNEVSEHVDGYLKGRSRFSTDLDVLVADRFDVAILVPSWDKRSLCITTAQSIQADLGLVIIFDDKDESGFRAQHDPIVMNFAKRRFRKVIAITGNSRQLNQLWREMLRNLVEVHLRVKRPLRIFVDGSACTRFLLLAVLATGLKSGLAGEVSAMYAEGAYRSNEFSTGERIVFTDGTWKSVAIPGLEGRYVPGLNRFYLVSIGFEGWKTMRAVTRADPDRVSILHGKPGTQAEYASKSLQENGALIEHFQVPSTQIVEAHAGDAIAAWRALSLAGVERPTVENSYFLCSGTKAHSLALALRAMSMGYPAVLYNLPESHRVVPIEANGNFWRFDIQSLTVPRGGVEHGIAPLEES